MSIEGIKKEIEEARNQTLLKFHQKVKNKINELVQDECDMDLEEFLDVYNYLKDLNNKHSNEN